MSKPLNYGLSQTVVDGITSVFVKHPNIQQAILYGSRAMDTYRPNSDIDLCLVGAQLTLTELLAIETDLDDLLLPYKIDLSLHNSIDNPELLAHIQRVGVVFYGRNHSKGTESLRALTP